MKTTLTYLFCIFCLTAFANSDKKQKEIKDNYSTCSYTIDKKTKLKDGEYIKIRNSNRDTLVIGHYENDRKVGLWKYKSPGNKDYITYNYDNQSVVCMDPAISKVDSFLIASENNDLYLLNKVDAPPIYLGFKGEVKSVINNNIKIPVYEMERGIHGVSAASFVIDRTGKITQIKIERSVSKSFDMTLTKAIEMLDSEWIPAKVNNSPTDAKMNIIVRVYNSTSHPKSKDKPYEIAIDLAYYVAMTKKYLGSEIRSEIISVPTGIR